MSASRIRCHTHGLCHVTWHDTGSAAHQRCVNRSAAAPSAVSAAAAVSVDGDPPSVSPWGPVEWVDHHGNGVFEVSTPSHGGVFLPPDVNGGIPDGLRNETGWYEEDDEAPRVIALLPHVFGETRADDAAAQVAARDDYKASVSAAINTYLDEHPAAVRVASAAPPTADGWRRVTGPDLDPMDVWVAHRDDVDSVEGHAFTSTANRLVTAADASAAARAGWRPVGTADSRTCYEHGDWRIEVHPTGNRCTVYRHFRSTGRQPGERTVEGGLVDAVAAVPELDQRYEWLREPALASGSELH